MCLVAKAAPGSQEPRATRRGCIRLVTRDVFAFQGIFSIAMPPSPFALPCFSLLSLGAMLEVRKPAVVRRQQA